MFSYTYSAGNTSIAPNSAVNDSTLPPQSFVCAVAGVPYFIGGTIISTCGILLNLSFIFVFCRVRYMKTLTNRYLVNLAMSDMLLLLSVLMYYIIRLTYGQVTDLIFNCALTYLHTVLLFVSLWMITIISIERYMGICNPLKARLFNTKGRTTRVIACTWGLGLLCSTPKLVQCALANTDKMRATQAEHTIFIMYFIMFLSSIVTVSCMYTLTVKNFKKSIKKLGKDRRTAKKSDETQVLVTCICISVVFFICTLPAAYKYVIHLIWQTTGTFYGGNFSICIYSLNRWFLLVNTSINPFIYTLTSARCRRAFAKAFLCYRKERKGGYPYSSSYANSATTNIGTDV
ncbi:thyrotropin-releasing hormone receptor-like [Glandiceps talaboti]